MGVTDAVEQPLRDRLAVTQPSEPIAPDEPTTAAVVVRGYLTEHVAALLDRAPEVRRDEPDAVHQMRVATRRLRSVLATFRPLLDRDVTDPLRDELKWLAGVLGKVRDAEVLLERLRGLAADEPAELAKVESSARLERELDETTRAGRVALTKALASRRYRRLLDGLVSVVTDPALTHVAQSPAGDVLPARVRHDWKRLRGTVRAAEAAGTAGERATGLHEVRKAAKRLRYASEALRPAMGRDAQRMAKAAKRLQTVLGEHNDSVVSRQLLRRLATQPRTTASDALLYGRLHALEQQQGARMEREYADAWGRLSKKRLRRWLSS